MWVRKTEKEIAKANRKKTRSNLKVALCIVPLFILLISIDSIVEGDLKVDDLKTIDPIYAIGLLLFLFAIVLVSIGINRIPKWISAPKPIYSPMTGTRVSEGFHGDTLICLSCHEVQVDEGNDGCRKCGGKIEPTIYWKEIDEK